MDSQVTLTNYSTTETSKGQVRLLYRRKDPHNAVLLEDDSLRYFLAMSNNMSKVKICDMAQQTVAEVNRRKVLCDILTLPTRNSGKAIKAEDVLRKAPSMDNSQMSMTLYTEEGTYHWRQRRGHNWALYENSSYTPVAWTETIPGSGPTWMLVLENRASTLIDYVLASLFYLKGEPEGTSDGLEYVDGRTALSTT